MQSRGVGPQSSALQGEFRARDRLCGSYSSCNSHDPILSPTSNLIKQLGPRHGDSRQLTVRVQDLFAYTTHLCEESDCRTLWQSFRVHGALSRCDKVSNSAAIIISWTAAWYKIEMIEG